MSHRHSQPVLPLQKYGLPHLVPPPFVRNVTIFRQRKQAAIVVSSSLYLRPTPSQHKHNYIKIIIANSQSHEEITVKESISIHDSADLVGKTTNSFPNIIPTTIAETKSTSTSVMES